MTPAINWEREDREVTVSTHGRMTLALAGSLIVAAVSVAWSAGAVVTKLAAVVEQGKKLGELIEHQSKVLADHSSAIAVLGAKVDTIEASLHVYQAWPAGEPSK